MFFISDAEMHDFKLSLLWLFLVELPLWIAVGTFLWVRDGSGLAVDEGESLIEVWAVLELIDWHASFGHILLLILFLLELVVSLAVVANLWVWHGSGLTVDKGESLVEVWAVRKAADWWSVWWISLSLLHELVVLLAVETNLWVWHGSCLAIDKGESLAEVWAVLECVDTWSPVWMDFCWRLSFWII